MENKTKRSNAHRFRSRGESRLNAMPNGRQAKLSPRPSVFGRTNPNPTSTSLSMPSGDTTKSLRIVLPCGSWVFVDANDYATVSRYRWFRLGDHKTSYALTKVRVSGKRVTCRMHRLILGALPGTQVDHINGNGLGNRRANLRFATHAENQRNRGVFKRSKSGFKGVIFIARSFNWMAKIKLNGRIIYLGFFHDKESAASAYDAAAFKYFGEFARFNFPQAIHSHTKGLTECQKSSNPETSGPVRSAAWKS